MAWRLERQHLGRRAPRSAMLDVTSAICGLHAQLMSSAELTLWARVEDLEPDAVQNALWKDRSLVKTWAMRGTLHLLPAAELPHWQAVFSTYQHYLKGAWLRAFGVSREELEALLAAVARALDGEMLTREELASRVSEIVGSTDLGGKLRESFGAMLKPAAFRGHLCFAPNAGQNVRFTRPDQWLRDWRPEDPAVAVPEITRRFLAACAPATRDDYARWWAVSPAEARRRIATLGDEVVEVDVDGTAAWMLREDATAAAEAEPSRTVRLVPAFDQYVVAATRHAEHLLPGDFRDRVYRPQGWLSPILLVGGRMDGVWRSERRGSRLVVTIEPFVKVQAWARAAAEEEAARLAAFSGSALELEWVKPS
jgi:winged helix DNA-binding protein